MGIGLISVVFYGLVGILLILWVYVRLMGSEGLIEVMVVVVLVVNYVVGWL